MTRTPFLMLILAATSLLASPAVPARGEEATQNPPLVFTGVTLIPGTDAPPASDRTLVISGGRILAVGKAGEQAIPSGANVVDGSEWFAIPGLWDMHVHLTSGTDLTLPALIANGVTGVRDMGGDLEVLDRWRKEIASGERPGPTIVRAGPVVDGVKPGAPFRLTLEAPDDAPAVVASLIEKKVDFVKVHNGVPREAYFALVKECRKQGIDLAGHVPLTVAPEEASDAGQRCLEHIATLFEGTFTARYESPLGMLMGMVAFKDGEESKTLFAQLARNGTWMAPTLIAYTTRARKAELADNPDPRDRYVAKSLKKVWDRFFPLSAQDRNPLVVQGRRQFAEIGIECVGRMHAAGVRLLAATDFGGRDLYPGFSLHDELELLVRAGLTPKEALHAATLAPAEYLGLTDELGTLEIGKRADLVLLEADPLENISNTRKIAGVVVGGHFLDREELDALLREVAAHAGDR